MTINSTRKIIVVLGQNASGKSDFAVRLAKKINGEIISADSRQVYSGLNIGSGKVEGKWKKNLKSQISNLKNKIFVYKNIIHHCIDFVSPRMVYTAGNFKKDAERAIIDIVSRGRVPIICGGTGFYIDAFLGNISLAEIPPNTKLRNSLEKKPREELLKILQKLNPSRAEKIDKQNKRRLIRAIEIIKHGRKSDKKNSQIRNKLNVFYIGVNRPPEILKQRIKNRLLARLKTGMIKEVRDLHFKKNISWKRLDDLGLEYRYVSYFLRGKIKSEKELFEKLKTEIWRYAKRQKTWFKKNKKINWTSLSEKDSKKIENAVEKFLTK